jgi:hypothetical protein
MGQRRPNPAATSCENLIRLFPRLRAPRRVVGDRISQGLAAKLTVQWCSSVQATASEAYDASVSSTGSTYPYPGGSVVPTALGGPEKRPAFAQTTQTAGARSPVHVKWEDAPPSINPKLETGATNVLYFVKVRGTTRLTSAAIGTFSTVSATWSLVDERKVVGTTFTIADDSPPSVRSRIHCHLHIRHRNTVSGAVSTRAALHFLNMSATSA